MDDRRTALKHYLNSRAERADRFRKPDEVATALKFYRGAPLGNEVEGRSKAVTRDVAEVVDQAVVNIMETMVSGENVVTFETDADIEATEGDANPIDAGEQATAAVHYWFMRKQQGYRVLHDACKAGLLEREGVVKTFVDRKRAVEVFRVPALALADPEFAYDEIEETDERDPAFDETDDAGRIFIAKRYVERPPVIRDMTVPYEEFWCDPDARDFDTSPYLKHERVVSQSDLLAMGFNVGDHTPTGLTHEELRKERGGDGTAFTWSEGAGRTYVLAEEYAFFDLNGDGIAERLCTFRIGGDIAEVFEVDDQPFSGWVPFPFQHAVTGDSLGDKTQDIQATNSVLLRNGLDSLYLGTQPRTLVHEDSIGTNTVDDLLDTAPSGIIRWKGTMAPTPYVTTDTSQIAFNAMEFMLAQRDSRTGINRHAQGLNPDSLNKTASGMAMLQDNGDKMLKYLARNFAEMLVAPMFARRYRLMRLFQQPFYMRIDGQRVLVDPSQWPEDVDVQINVGLGSNRREQRVQGRMAMLGIQEKAMAAGLPIVKPEHIYNSIRGLARDLAIGTHTDFVADPATIEPQQEQPDPAAIEAEAKAQREAEANQIAMWKAQEDVRLREMEIMLKDQRERDRMDREFALAAHEAAQAGAQGYRPGGALDR